MTSEDAVLTSSTRSRFTLALGLLALTGLLPMARAGTITQSLDFRLNANTASSVLHFDAFDTGLGSLEGVAVSFVATRRHDWAIWNISGAAAAMNYQASLTDTTLTLDGNAFGFADLAYGPATTPVLASTGFPVYLLQFLSARNQFLMGANPVFPTNAYHPDTVLTTISDSFAPVTFDGVVNLAYSYNPGLFEIASSGFFAGSLVDVAGTVTVDYTYRAVPVPDSPLGAGLLAITCAGMLWLVRHRRVPMRVV